jgi:hypothetical protein
MASSTDVNHLTPDLSQLLKNLSFCQFAQDPLAKTQFPGIERCCMHFDSHNAQTVVQKFRNIYLCRPLSERNATETDSVSHLVFRPGSYHLPLRWRHRLHQPCASLSPSPCPSSLPPRPHHINPAPAPNLSFFSSRTPTRTISCPSTPRS